MFGGLLREKKGQYYCTADTLITINPSIVITTTYGMLRGVAPVPGEGHSTHIAEQVHYFNQGIPNLLYIFHRMSYST